MELEEQRRRHGVVELRISVDGVHHELVEKLDALKAVKDSEDNEAIKKAADELTEVATSTPEEFRKMVENEIQRWTRVIKDAGIRQE